jgi:hypothetical protein
MSGFFNQRQQLIIMVAFWTLSTLFLGPIAYATLPLSVFYLRSRELWPDLLIGFLFILIMSDMDPMFVNFRYIKSAKYGMMVAMALVFLTETQQFAPQSIIFRTFLPFFLFAYFPIINGNDPINGISKATSYALLYLIIPNFVLLNFRRYGWDFFRHLFVFLIILMYSAYLFYFVHPYYVRLGGRFRSFFGNPNGLGIFNFLFFMLYSTCLYLKKDLFPLRTKLIIYAAIVFLLVACGSRTAVVATGMFYFFSRFFAVSPFIGFLVFVLFVAGLEYAQQNLIAIVQSLGLQKFFRVETLEDGSGRYFAWAFAWEKINTEGYFLFGGGFGNDEWVMRHNYDYLRKMGHDGGVHNSYLTMWFNTGIVGIMLYFRSFVLIFVKANKRAPIAFAIMFSVLFSVLYESWLTGSLNPYSIMLLMIMTILTEDDIVGWEEKAEQQRLQEEGAETQTVAVVPVLPKLILPAR